MHLQVKNVIHLKDLNVLTEHNSLCFPPLPFDSFARLQFFERGIDIHSLRQTWLSEQSKNINYFESPVSQSQMSIEILKALQNRSAKNPDLIIHVAHFPNEDWFDFVNMRILKELAVKCPSFSIIGLGCLGIPMAVRHALANSSLGTIWIIATDRVVAPYVRLVPHLGIISDSAIGIELQHADHETSPVVAEVSIRPNTVGSWYQASQFQMSLPTTLGKDEFWNGWLHNVRTSTKTDIHFDDMNIGSSTISLR